MKEKKKEERRHSSRCFFCFTAAAKRGDKEVRRTKQNWKDFVATVEKFKVCISQGFVAVVWWYGISSIGLFQFNKFRKFTSYYFKH